MRIAIIASSLVAAVALTTPALAEESSGKARFHQFMWQQLDTDGDGMISRQESDARRQALFAEADLDGDGKLNFEEMLEYQELRRQLHRQARFKALDADGDGVISQDELAQRADRFWARLDADGDGAITPDEMREGRKRHHRR